MITLIALGIGLGALLVGVVGAPIIHGQMQEIATLRREIEDLWDREPVTFIHPMAQWTDEAIEKARNAYIRNGWIPSGYNLYEVRVYGPWPFAAGVIAASQAEAIERIRQGYVVYGATPDAMKENRAWCQNGYDAFMLGLTVVGVDSPVFDSVYECVGVMRVYPAAEQAVRRYAFTFTYGDVMVDNRYRVYRATVEAAGLYAALDVLFSGKVELINDADSDLTVSPATDGRVAAAFAMLTPETTVGAYAYFNYDDASDDTTAAYEVISDLVTAEPVAA